MKLTIFKEVNNPMYTIEFFKNNGIYIKSLNFKYKYQCKEYIKTIIKL